MLPPSEEKLASPMAASPGHALINHHSMQVIFVTAAVGGGHVAGNVAVLQSDGVLAFNNQTLGVVGGKSGIFYGDICGTVNSRAAHAAGGIRAAVHIDGARRPGHCG